MERVRKVFGGIRDRQLWFNDTIRPGHASAVTKAWARNISQDAIMLLYDTGSGGLLLTVDTIYWYNKRGKAEECRYTDILEIEVTKGSLGANLLINREEINLAGSHETVQAVRNFIRNL